MPWKIYGLDDSPADSVRDNTEEKDMWREPL